MNSAFFGTWNLDKSRTTGKEEFAQAFGVPQEQFEQLSKIQLTLTISQNGDKYDFVIDFHGVVPTQTVTLLPGEASEVAAMDGSKAQVTLAFEGDAVKESYTSDRGNWELTRTVSGNEQKVVTVFKDATLTQFLVKA